MAFSSIQRKLLIKQQYKSGELNYTINELFVKKKVCLVFNIVHAIC